MKLLFCKACGDVVKLRRHEMRWCDCGKAGGKYRADGAHADVTADALVIGLANGDVQHAVMSVKNPDAGYRTIRAWLMGYDAPRVHWEAAPSSTAGEQRR